MAPEEEGRRSDPLRAARATSAALRAARDPQAASLSYEEKILAAERLAETGAAGLAWEQVAELRDARARFAGISAAAGFHRMQARLAVTAMEEAQAALDAAGIRWLLAKGPALARLYRDPELRPSADLDILADPEQFDLARRVVTGLRAPVPVDLHPAYPKMPERPWAMLWERRATLAGNTSGVRTPCEEDHLRLLCIHFLSHGGWRPLWLLDIALLRDLAGDRLDVERLLAGPVHRRSWVESVLSLAATLLGSEPLPSSPPHPEWLERAVLEAWAAAPGASGMARGRGFLGVARATRSRWRGPIQALFELEAAVVGVPPRPLARLRATVRRGLDRLRGRD